MEVGIIVALSHVNCFCAMFCITSANTFAGDEHRFLAPALRPEGTTSSGRSCRETVTASLRFTRNYSKIPHLPESVAPSLYLGVGVNYPWSRAESRHADTAAFCILLLNQFRLRVFAPRVKVCWGPTDA